RLLEPRAVVFRPEVRHEENSLSLNRLDELADEGVTCGVDPVNVVDQNDGGLALGASLRETPKEAKEGALTCFAIDQRGGALGVADAEKLEADRQDFANLLA